MKRTLLVADDEPSVLETTRFILEAEGYHVLVARNGDDALALARRERPRVLLLDVHMPRRSGLEVCRALRSEFADALVILILTARGQEEDEQAALSAGADAFIRKPFVEAELLESLEQAFADEKITTAPLAPSPFPDRHDRDNVLSGLMGAVRILEKGLAGPLSPEQARFVAVIRECAEQLGRM